MSRPLDLILLTISTARRACTKCALALWAHRTTAVGVIGISAGTLESFIADHPEIKLPHRGSILIGFAAVVTGVGLYNTVLEFLKRRAAEAANGRA